MFFILGHVGVYIGNGKVIEARGHKYGVVETNLVGRGWKQWGKLDWIDYVDEKAIELFKDGDELKALDYLVENGRIDKNKQEHWKKTIDVVNFQKWIFIEWANDVKALLN